MNSFPCKKNCGAQLTWDYGISGKKGPIPTHLDGTVHDCPKAKYRISNLSTYDDLLINAVKQILDRYNALLRRKKLILHVEDRKETPT